jgi:hypothetical protein
MWETWVKRLFGCKGEDAFMAKVMIGLENSKMTKFG